MVEFDFVQAPKRLRCSSIFYSSDPAAVTAFFPLTHLTPYCILCYYRDMEIREKAVVK